MKKLALFCVLALSIAFTTGLRAEGGKHEEETPVGLRMDRMREAFKKLRKEASDPAKAEESLKLVADLKKAAEEAVTLTPALAAEIPAEKREAFVADYQKDMKAFVVAVEKLETTLKEGHFDQTAKLIEELHGLQKQGHKEFKKPDEKH